MTNIFQSKLVMYAAEMQLNRKDNNWKERNQITCKRHMRPNYVSDIEV